MPEIQSIQPLTIPSWVMMDQRFRFKDPGSFDADGETSAETKDGNGKAVRVSFDLQTPPGSSRLCFHCPVEREPSWWDIVVASHGNAVLFRIEVEFDGSPFIREHTLEYFIYRACSPSSSAPKLTLLPRSYCTEAEIMEPVAQDVDFWRRNWCMVDSNFIGLLTNEVDFVVAELYISGDADEAAPLEAQLFRLHSSPGATHGGGQWELMLAKSRGSKVRFKDVLCWETHKVVPFTSYLCWVDYNRGVLFCDVFHKTPDLQYLQLPIDDGPHIDYPKLSRTVCVTNKGETMNFVKVDYNKIPSCPNCKHGSAFTISVWTLRVMNYDDMEWVPCFQITADELWAMEGYDHDHLPRIVPRFPLVSMDEPSILYFVLCDEEITWMVTLDMENKTILRYDDDKAFPSDNIFRGFGFFPSNFSNYMQKQSRVTVSEQKKKINKNRKRNKN